MDQNLQQSRIANVANTQRLAKQKLRQSARKDRDKQSELRKKQHVFRDNMADASRKSRSAIRVKSSEKERKKSASKRDSATSRSHAQSEEEKESLAWKILSEEQTQSLKELTVYELEVKLADVLSLDHYHVSLPEACILDYYVAGFWLSKEQNFNLQQTSALFTLLKIMLDNMKENGLSLVENIQKLKSLLAGIGVENCPHNGGLECFDVSQAKVITDYFTDSLFQHYKLYQFLFTQEPQEEVIVTELATEVPPLADIPFPPPLDEGMTEVLWREYVMTPPQSPTPEKEKEGEVQGEVKLNRGEEVSQLHPEGESVGDILSSVKPEEIKRIVKKVADEVLGNFKAEVDVRLKEREAMLTTKIGKLHAR